MKPAEQPTTGIDDTTSPGVREDTPARPLAHASGTRETGDTMSAQPRTPPDSWPADDEQESELPVPKGTLLDSKYTVERVFAEGGMGIVCLGRHVQLDQPVAIKFLRRALAGRPAIAQRFLNEARALAALRSEHVVRVMDVGQLASGRPYLVMEHLEGTNLDALLARDGPLSVEVAVEYALQVCEPLAEAHALGIVHRDIKPENLFLWSGGPTADRVKVLDFGLAKQLGTSRALGVTGPQDSLGSPCYMSPEQVATPQSVDARTDIWSLGVVLYQLLTKVSPFDGGSLVEVLSHILNAAPVPLTEHLPALDGELDAIVRRCLEKRAEDRYQTMSQLADALRDYLSARQRSRLLADGPSGDRGDLPRTSSKPAKIAIPGVHSRWPAASLVIAVLLGAAIFQMDRSGMIRLRALGEGWLTPARLATEVDAALSKPDHQQTLPFLRGIAAGDVVRLADGMLAPRAVVEPERSVAARAPVAAGPAPMSDEERARRQAAYADYLKSEGLTPLSEALPGDSGEILEAPDR